MTAVASMFVQGRISLAAVGTAIGSYTEAYDIVSESLTSTREHLDASGIRATRQHSQERVAQGTDKVGGSIVFEPGTPMAILLLPRILGGAISSHVVPFAEALPAFDVLVDKVAKRFVYTNCVVDKATFSAKPNEKLKLAIDVKAYSEAVSATAFPAISAPLEAPWVFSQGVITLNSAVRAITEFSVVVDNSLDVRFTNSQTATDISPKDQHIHLTCMAPYTSDNYDLYGLGTTASAGTLVFTNGSNVLTFTFGALQYEDRTPHANGRGEIFLPIKATARKTGSTAALSFTTAP